MGILIVAAAMQVALLAVCWSCSRWYYERGRRRGLNQCADEILRGAQGHLGSAEAAHPKAVHKTLAKFKRVVVDPNCSWEPASWDFGNAVGEACWQQGFAEGVAVGAKPADMIRIDLSLKELLQMSWLAHLGFQHMMPNYRGIEVHRFSGCDEAFEAARSVGILECALPKADRPFADIKTQILGREKMITDWWTVPTREVA
ncbi:MAG: hypothetical protein ABWY10_00710 [Tardiphaga sp.]